MCQPKQIRPPPPIASPPQSPLEMIKWKSRGNCNRGRGRLRKSAQSRDKHDFGKNVRSLLFIFTKISMGVTSGTKVKAEQIHYCHLLITDPLMIVFINRPPTKAWPKRDHNNEVTKGKVCVHPKCYHQYRKQNLLWTWIAIFWWRS